MNATQITLTWALEYQSRGWSLLPTLGKRPHAGLLRQTEGKNSWKHFQSCPADEDRLHAWFGASSSAGIGVITGEVSNLAIVDFDHGPFPPVGARLPQTAMVSTGRPNGLHLYYAGSSDTQKHPGGEIRGNGSFVVAPPSRHSGGKFYRWRLSPEDLADAYGYSLAPFAAVSLAQNRDEIAPHPIPSSLGTSLGTSLGGSLRQFNAEEGAVAAMAKVLGITTRRLGSAFRCVLHPDRTPSATLCKAADGVWLYHDWHAQTHDEAWLSLPVVYARLRGRTGQLSPSEIVCWQARLVIEAGVLSPAETGLPMLSADAPEVARRVHDGFRLLLGCKWLDEVGVPTTFSRRFAASWCEVSVDQAHEGIRWLEMHGYLARVGEVDGQFRHGALLWLPGDPTGEHLGGCSS